MRFETPAAASATQARVWRALDDFAGRDCGRSVVVQSTRGEPVAAEVRGDAVRPAASLAKLMVVGAVRAAALDGRLDLDAPVGRSQLPTTRYASVLAAFGGRHLFTVRELCALCLITSDNPTADYLLELVGPEGVNRFARSLGCHRTRLEIGFGDEQLGPPGRANLTTAVDAVALVSRVVSDDPEIAHALANNLRNQRIPLRLRPETTVPHKTGTLESVVNDAGLVLGQRTDLAMAFLCDGQADPARTAIAIGDCVAEIRIAVGESVASAPTAPAVHSRTAIAT